MRSTTLRYDYSSEAIQVYPSHGEGKIKSGYIYRRILDRRVRMMNNNAHIVVDLA